MTGRGDMWIHISTCGGQACYGAVRHRITPPHSPHTKSRNPNKYRHLRDILAPLALRCVWDVPVTAFRAGSGRLRWVRTGGAGEGIGAVKARSPMILDQGRPDQVEPVACSAHPDLAPRDALRRDGPRPDPTRSARNDDLRRTPVGRGPRPTGPRPVGSLWETAARRRTGRPFLHFGIPRRPGQPPQSLRPRYARRRSSCQRPRVLTRLSPSKLPASASASAMLAVLALALSA